VGKYDKLGATAYNGGLRQSPQRGPGAKPIVIMLTLFFVFTNQHIVVSGKNSFCINKNSSPDEIANVNFYAVRQEATRIH